MFTPVLLFSEVECNEIYILYPSEVRYQTQQASF